ncbi:MAG: aminopeptidase [Elusimicrobiales bacterium]|jgi:aspartyl aminopeptidase|nr:aminopeptidase [Elusimicrobiales bacterium]NLH39190.1 aminopeptidase [Elusimicrobiota bacterium]
METKEKKDKKTDISYQRKNGWELIDDKDKKNIDGFSYDYMEFLSKSKIEREFHDNSVELLKSAGFKEISAYKSLKAGDRVYVSNYGKTLFAFVIGKNDLTSGMHIVGAHIDSPRIDIKQNPLYENTEIAYFDTHYYGGIKKYQWLTIPLSLHGVIVKKNGEKIKINIGDDDSDPVFCITDLLPHLAQSQMKKTLSEAVEGENLDIIVGSVPVNDKDAKEKVKQNILNILNEKYSITEEDFLSAELEIVPAARPREVGFDRSMILAYGHDDKVCAYTALKAMLDADKIPDYTSCLILADKEEIGSYGATGMGSNSFENATSEILNLYYGSYNELSLKRLLKNSWMLSADVNAVLDPLFPSVSEKKNSALLNYGICVTKYTGARGKGGASDANAEFVAEVRRIFDSNKVVWQTGELGKVDEGGGGTIAHYLARYGMQVVDCGVGLMSMHAPMEIASKLDIYMAYKAYLAFYNDRRK